MMTLDERDLDELVAMGAKFFIDGVEASAEEVRREILAPRSALLTKQGEAVSEAGDDSA